MRRYYADLRAELEEQVRRATSRGEDLARFAGRHEALDREECFRTGELRQKGSLRVELRLLTLLQVQQPKLLVGAVVLGPRHAAAALELVWDPLTSALEAAPCPACGRPTFAWAWTRQGSLVCPACAAAPPPKAPRHGR